MLKLFIGKILDICIFNNLLKLSFRLLSSINGIDSLFRLPRRIVLRNHWSYGSFGKLLLGVLFCHLLNVVLFLRLWNQPEQWWLNELYRLLSRDLFC